MLNIITRIIAIMAVSATLSAPVAAEQLQSILREAKSLLVYPKTFHHSDLLERILNMKDMMLT